MALGSAEAEGGEGCDVLVDDIIIGCEPGFRDGIVSQAVDEVVGDGALYFSSAGNFRTGFRFTSVSFLGAHIIRVKTNLLRERIYVRICLRFEDKSFKASSC